MDERPQNPVFSCKTCGKSYASAYGRRRHQKAVHDGKQYECRVCGNLYRRPEYVARHMKVHSTTSDAQSAGGVSESSSSARAAADREPGATNQTSPVHLITSEGTTAPEGAFLFVHGQWYTAHTIQSVGLTLSEPPQEIKSPTRDIAAQTEAV